jgi:peptidoglycan/LPS O-acetylase OafA/YrhL
MTIVTSSKPGFGHRPELDGLRGVAILLVMLAHASIPGFAAGGVAGVTLFFVLSGFLITSILASEHVRSGRVSFGLFYRRRALRLLPALIALIVVGCAYESVDGFDRETAQHGLIALLYFGNWSSVAGTWLGPWFGHTWSLAIEEQFYLVWPLVLILLLAIRRYRLAVAVVGVGAALATAERAILWHGSESSDRVYFGTDTRADALLLGAALALWTARGGRILVGRWVGVLGVALLIAAIPLTGSWTTYVLSPTLAAVGALLILAYLAHAGRGKPLRIPFLRFSGRISYGLYLWHVPLVWVLLPHLTDVPLLVRAIVLFVVSYGLAMASYRWIELPFLRRKNRLASPQDSAIPTPRQPAEMTA